VHGRARRVCYHLEAMQIEVLCFASARDAVGAPRLVLELGEGATVRTALAALAERHPALRAGLGALRCAVNEDFADASRGLAPGDTLALLPPVSGG